jgi:hypothetical protein
VLRLSRAVGGGTQLHEVRVVLRAHVLVYGGRHLGSLLGQLRREHAELRCASE